MSKQMTVYNVLPLVLHGSRFTSVEELVSDYVLKGLVGPRPSVSVREDTVEVGAFSTTDRGGMVYLTLASVTESIEYTKLIKAYDGNRYSIPPSGTTVLGVTDIGGSSDVDFLHPDVRDGEPVRVDRIREMCICARYCWINNPTSVVGFETSCGHPEGLLVRYREYTNATRPRHTK